jgi:uncharacterized protein
MDDEVWSRDEIDSPCVKICVQHPQAGICIGCCRTAEEVRNWSGYSPQQRRAILDELPGRTKNLRGTRRGRKARRQG